MDRKKRSGRLQRKNPEFDHTDLDKVLKKKKNRSKPGELEVSNLPTEQQQKRETMSTQFDFDSTVTASTFKGDEFYGMHSSDIFLTDLATVEGILCQGKRIRQQLKTLQPGQILTIGNAQRRIGVPLTIRKGGPGVEIKDDEYTLNRLTGMCAAYSATQGSSFNPKCAMAITLGLDVAKDRILYYSAAPGSEHFAATFTWLPLLCALKQLENGKVSKENISRIAAVKDASGNTLSALLIRNKTAIPNKLLKFGAGGTRGLVELEKALNVLKSLSTGASSSRS